MWAFSRPGELKGGYGTWVEGVREGFFAEVTHAEGEQGKAFLIEYVQGELKRKIKWRLDKLHKKCSRCNFLFVPSANKPHDEKLCRFHPKSVDVSGRFPCCDALQENNPRGCCTS